MLTPRLMSPSRKNSYDLFSAGSVANFIKLDHSENSYCQKAISMESADNFWNMSNFSSDLNKLPFIETPHMNFNVTNTISTGCDFTSPATRKIDLNQKVKDKKVNLAKTPNRKESKQSHSKLKKIFVTRNCDKDYD